MSSIFPFMDPAEVEVAKDEVPMAVEYAWDIDKCEFKLKNNKMYKVEGKEAVKIWIWKALSTQRYRELIYSWNYGSELESLIGKGYSQGYLNSEAERFVREALESTLSDYIEGVKNFNIRFKESTLIVEFVAVTIYGEVMIIV